MSKRILIVGYNELAKNLASRFESENLNTRIIGYTENTTNIKELSHYPILGDVNSTVEVSKKLNVNEIYSTITPLQNPDLYSLIQQAENECIRFKVISNGSGFVKDVPSSSINFPLLSYRKEALEELKNKMLKRAFDIFISFFVLLFILSLLTPLVGILIIIDSGGPVFFSQLRLGKNKTLFRCFKFRSMYINGNANLEQAKKNDKRITKIGRLLRQTNIDEFPQFLNVFLGHMSLVGPRPHMIKDAENFSGKVGHYMVRHLIKPGITGWAQIKSYRGETTEVEQVYDRLQHDLWYLENWSFWLDIRIIFLTVVQAAAKRRKML